MKYKVGDTFTVFPLGKSPYVVRIKNIKYEFDKNVASRFKYLSEKDVSNLEKDGILIEGTLSELEAECKRLELKYGVKLNVSIESGGKVESEDNKDNT